MSKYSITLTKTSNTSDFIIPFSDSLSPNKEYQIGLVSFSTYNNIYNITKDNNLFRFTKRIELGDDDYRLEDSYYPLKPGAYELQEIIDHLKNRGGGYFLKEDLTGIVYMHLPEKCQIDFSEGDSFHELLGFEKKLYYGKLVFPSKNPPKIRSVQTINIECDIAKSYLYSFPTNTVPLRAKIDERMNPPLYLPIIKKGFDNIHIRILDQDGNLINFNNSEINIFLHLREI